MKYERLLFPKLFEACNIGILQLRNRIIMPPCTTNFAKDGFVTDKMKKYYGTIVKGGVGMIVVEDGIIDSSVGRHTFSDIYIDDDKYIPGLTQLANCIKAHGTRAAINLNHGGRRSGRIINGRLEFTNGRIPVAPSSLPHFEPGFVVPRQLTSRERSLHGKLAMQSVLWVSDCVQPRNILEAVHEGFEAGATV